MAKTLSPTVEPPTGDLAASAIRVEGLTKDFGSQRAVDHLTFDIPAGGVTGFVGPNGSTTRRHRLTRPPTNPVIRTPKPRREARSVETRSSRSGVDAKSGRDSSLPSTHIVDHAALGSPTQITSSER